MEKKKIVGCIIFLFILMISLLNSHVYAEPMSPSLYFGITELRASGMGYSIGDPDANGTTGEAAKIWNIVQYSGPSASNYTETNVYCVKAGYGFTTGAGTDEIQEYDVKFDMYTDRTSIAAQNDVLNGLVNGGHYNELLALLNIIYIPGESTEAEKDQLLTNAGIYQDQYPELFRLTDDEIEAVQQAAIWYFTNYGEENGKYDKYNNTAWLWYTEDGKDYSNLSGYNPTNVDPNSGAGRARQEQAELLYKYLIDTAKANANQYADGSTDHKHKITLYASTENAMAQPLVEVEKNPEDFDLALRKYITEVNGTPVDTRTPNIDESTLENGTTATYKHRKDPVLVRLGDTITYNITIYNEGDLDGRATQIIDQLPTGLRYAGINTQGYTAQYDETTNRVTITKQTTENLAGYDGQGLDFETIEIECTVETNEGDQILTNLAWIAEEVDENGTVITNQVGADRDSEPSTITVPTKDELVTTDIGYIGNSSNTGKDLADSNNYFEGQQDDDDFEKVIVQEVTGAYQVQLEKVDENGNVITAEAGFRWTLPGQSEQTGTTSNGRLNLGTVQITDPSTTDTIQITETSAPAGYSPLVGSLTVQVTKGESNGNYVATGAQITAGGVEGAEVSLNGNVITITVPNKPQEFDLSLRKFISEVDGTEYDRAPDVDLSGLESGTTAIYNHPKDPIMVKRGSVVIYTIRVYNEAEVDGYAEEITDYLPEELEFLPDHEINLQYEWQVSSDGRTVTTDYLSSAKETDERQNLIHGFDGTTLDYKDVQIACQVREEAEPNVKLTNLAEITEDKNDYDIPDRDSTPDNVEVPSDDNLPGYKDDEINQDYVPGQEDDDDFEKVVISQEFDLALRKFITKVNEEDVTTRIPEVSYDREQNQITYNHTKDPVQVATGNVVEYTIRVYNEGNMAGYAQEITDDIPEGLRFLPENATNTEYRWVMYDAEGNVTENAEDAVEIRTDYLSKEQEETAGENLLQAFNPDEAIGEGNPDYRDVKVAFEVIEPNTSDKTIINSAQISEDSDENGNPVEDIDSIPDEWNEGEDDQDREYIKLTYFDLALRKFITKVDEEDVTTRIPEISYDRDQNQITYNHTKDPVEVVTGNVVEYTIRIYNEGDIAGYAEEVADDIPDGLRFLPENATNTEYRWVMYDEEGNVTENVEEAVEIRTDYLSKEQGEERLNGEETTGEGTAENPNLLQAFNPDEAIGEGNPDYRDIKVAFEVVEPNTSDRIIVNSAQITEDSDENGNPVEDIDSIPDEWNEGEDDQDREYIKLTYFDLALRKWVTEAIVIENGKETVTQTGHTAEMDPEPVVKVELYRKNINDVTVKFRYSIRITNEGDIAGYAKEITDYVPEGLRFLAEDNPGWTDEGNNVISTRLLENTLLQPGESAEVEVVLTWINGEDNMGQMTNIAEISEDYNDKGVPDRDSTPDNRRPGEDDIDDAPVLLSVETGQERIYFVLGFTVLGTLAGGLVLIRKFVI